MTEAVAVSRAGKYLVANKKWREKNCADNEKGNGINGFQPRRSNAAEWIAHTANSLARNAPHHNRFHELPTLKPQRFFH